MLINQHRIASLKRLSFIEKGERIRVGVNLSNIDKKKLDTLGLGKVGEKMRFLPPIVGPVSKFNADGKEEKLKDLPKEICYYEILWTRRQRAGRGMTEEVSDIVDRPYERYQRKFIAPVGIELFKENGFVYGPILIFGNDNERIIHTINLFLELFGECEILGDKYAPLVKDDKLKRFNWEFIKPGTAWKEIEKYVNNVAKNKSMEQKTVIYARLKFAESLGLEPVGCGILGFSGYIAFQDKNKKYTIFENINYGNAIYITDIDRLDFSKKDKQTILSSQIQKDRIIHQKGWKNKLKKYCQ